MKKSMIIKVLVLLLLGAVGVQAENNVYTGSAGDNDFNNDANWWNSVDPTDSAFFRGDNLTNHPTWAFPNLSATDTVSRVVFQGSFPGSYTISGEKLTIDGNGDAHTLLIESASANTNDQTFANTVELVSINNANNRHIKTFGTGTLIFSGTLSQTTNSEGIGIGLGYGDIEVSGNVDGSSGKLWKLHNDAGDGIMKVTGSGTWSGGSDVQIATGAELLLARDTTDSSGFSPGNVQLRGGTLTLGNDEQIGDGVDVFFTAVDGGLFDLNGYKESVRQLLFNLTTISGTLDMGDGGVLHLENQSSTVTWGSLIVTNWSEGVEHVYVDGGSFSSSQLAAITFDGYAAGAQVVGGELYPASLTVVVTENNVYTGVAGDKDLNNDANWWNTLETNDVAFFRGDNIAANPAWASPSFSSPTTLSGVKFSNEPGASYVISGSDLTIDGVGLEQTLLVDMVASYTQTFLNHVELVSLNSANNRHIKTTGTGTLVFAGTLSQGSASTGLGIGLGYGDLEVSGNVDGSSSKLWKLHNDAGDGIMKLTGSGTWSNDGTVQVATDAELLLVRDTTDSSGFVPSSVQLGGGTLTLGNNEQIGDTVTVYYTSADGGLFDLDGYTESVGQLRFNLDTSTGVLDLGDGGVLHIENQSSTAIWGSLVVTGWESGSDHIYVDGGSFSASQLAGITFDGYADGAKVESGELLPVGAPLGFSGWIDDYNLAAGQDAADADPDGDGVANLYEYGFGGNPTNAAMTGTLPTYVISGSAVEIVHVELTDVSGISYAVQQTPSLVLFDWTPIGISFVGESAEVGGFKTVTNQVSSAASVKFMQVLIEED